MIRHEAAFLQRLRAAFLAEARDHLLAIDSELLALEKAGSLAERARQVELVFRRTHSLKGAARAASFPRIEAICQALEEIFSLCKRRGRILSAGNFDVLHQAFDLVRAQVDAGGCMEPDASPPAAAVAAAVLGQVRAIIRGEPDIGSETVAGAVLPAGEDVSAPVQRLPAAAEEEMFPASPVATAAETVRIQTPRLDRMLLAAEELLTVKQAQDERTGELQQLEVRFGQWPKRWLAVQPTLRKLRGLVSAGDASSQDTVASAAKALEFLEWSYGYVRALEDTVRALARSAARDSHLAAKQIDELLEDSKSLLMLPFSTLTEVMPKLVRDLARDQRKEVDLEVSGEDVQLDKRMLELLRDPLVHMVRNALDHGIEASAQRQAAGKPARATLWIQARLLPGNRIGIEIADDGAGLDPEQLRKSAVRAGVVSGEQAAQLDPAQTLELAFRSDVSTSAIITEISGRGLGLAIVREQVEKLGGRVEVENRAPHGARFCIELPQSMATLRGLFVEAGGQVFVIPSAHIERVARVPKDGIKTVGHRETLSVDGQVLPVAHLHELLELPTGAPPGNWLSVVFIGTGQQRVALVVEDVLRDEEVLVKRLRRPLVRLRNVAGATVLASGKPLPILNVADLIKSAKRDGAPGPTQRAVAGANNRLLALRVLLAEDSITSRLLLKGILESAGCNVTTAADGIEAFTALRSGPFDLLVSDIEMPRLNGFDLTAQIRADHKLADLPIVLVTALSRREDRERGMDVGANAYITKGSFDQRELLAAVRRLAISREPT